MQKNVCETSQQVLIFFKKLTLFHSAIYHAIALKHSTFNFIGLPLSLSHTAGCEMSRFVAVIAYKCESSREATLKFNWSVTAQYAGMSSLHSTMLGMFTASEQELTISWLGGRFYSIPSNSWPSWLQSSLIKKLGSPAIKCFRNAPKWDRISWFHQMFVFVPTTPLKVDLLIVFAAFVIKRWKWFCPINT